MVHIQHKNYIILKFSGLQNSLFETCLGIIGYLFIIRMGKFKTSYIPATFIRLLSDKCKVDIIDYLIINNFLIKQPSKYANTQYYNATGLSKPEKRDANIYIPQQKLIDLNSIYLFDDVMTKYLDAHIHILNNQYFNHYNHSYKYIKVNLPYSERIQCDISVLNILDRWGDKTIKDYDISDFGYDDKFTETHINTFTFNQHLLKYTSIVKPIKIGIMHSIPIILADQLLKTIGKNDYSDFYLKSRFKNALFRLSIDYNIFNEIFEQQFYSAIYGFEHIDEFNKMFPKAHSLLWRIKNGGRGVEPDFIGFTSNLNPKILKNDKRLNLKLNHPALKRGQAYYKIIPLVCMIREVKILRDIWRRLKKCDIPFIPLQSSIVIPTIYEKTTIYIFEDIINQHIDKRLKFIVEKNLII